MPLTDLIRYFNAADNKDDSLLYADGQRAAAWHKGLRLESRFQPIVDLRQKKIVGHQASLFARDDHNQPVNDETAYGLNHEPAEIIHFDRLCRTLHALNFLAQRRYAGGYLQMSVHPRHLQAVQNQHGLVYEAILKRCGLAPEDIVLSIAFPPAPNQAPLGAALDNYRHRGYRLALAISAKEADLDSLRQLRPDILRLDHPAPLPWPDVVEIPGIKLETSGIEHSQQLILARNSGIDLGLGSLFGSPASDCQPTHSEHGVAYN